MYAAIAKCVQVLYALCSLFPKQRKIAFFSRQGKRVSLDVRMLSEAVRKKCPDVQVVVCTTDAESKDVVAFAFSILSMIYHVATSRVCVLEGYIPAVSIPRLNGQTYVVQLWHALGAIKKFGYQSVGTKAGRSAKVAKAMCMHKNYDCIIAAGPGAVSAYAEAFGYSSDVVKPFGMPRMDYLLEESSRSERLKKADRLRRRFPILQTKQKLILYVPTLRKGNNYEGWMNREVKLLAQAFESSGCQLLVMGHPLDKGCDASLSDAYGNVHFIEGVASIDLLEFADQVVTDYSAIAFEAGLLGRPVWFYVPDICDYCESPGLNIDPCMEFPSCSFTDAVELAKAIKRAITTGDASATKPFEKFICHYFADASLGATKKLTSHIAECYFNTFKVDRG